MKKTLSSILVLAMVLMTFASTSFAAEPDGFVDIEKSYAKDAILELQSLGIIDGIDASHFNPSGKLSRAEFVAIMVRALGLETTATTSSFSDVTGWSLPYVEAAVKAGIVTGIGNGMFAPGEPLTREAAAVILVRALQSKGLIDDGAATLDFVDADKIAEWAKPFIAIAQKYGLINGNSSGTFNPKGTADRAMAAVMGSNLLTAIDEVVAPTPTPSPTPSPSPSAPPVTGGGGGGGPVITPTPTPTPSPVAVSNVHIASDNADTTKATVGDTVTLTFATSEQVTKLSNFKINGGNPATFVSTGSGTAWLNTATYVIDPTDPLAVMTFQINVKNSAGIYSQTIEVTTDSSAVTVVAPAPITGGEAEEYVQPQDFGYWVDATPDSAAYNVGFTLNLNKMPYSNIAEIEVSLLDGSDNVLAKRTATGTQLVQLASDDEDAGDLDGQLSAAFIYREAADTNYWWNSTAYDFTTPAKAVISITDNANKVYVVTNDSPTGGSSGEVSNPQDYLQAQDFGYWDDQFAYNVGFKIDVEKLPYGNMRIIEVALTGASGEVLATRTATGEQIAKLAADDATYEPIDGQLSAAFIYRDAESMNDWWTSTPYNMTTPSKAVITIIDKSNRIFKVESGSPSSTPPVYVEMQDFGPLDDGYNLGFKLNLDALGGYDNIESITGSVTDAVYGEVSRIAIDTPQRLMNYMAADSADGLDGQLSFDFRTQAYVDEHYNGGQTDYTNYIKPIDDEYDGTPTSVQIVIVTMSGATIIVNHAYTPQ